MSNLGGCSTYLSGAFGALTPDQANGDWKLTVIDAVGLDAGTLNAATLRIEQDPVQPANRLRGFVSPGECTRGRDDFTGTGRTSFAVVRDEGGELRWLILGFDGTGTGQPLLDFLLGTAATDFVVPGDYDGDGITDAAVWTPDPSNPPGRRIVVRRSSRPGDDPLVLPLGVDGDDPTLMADYDGDGVTDPAILRLPAFEPAPGELIRLLSTDGGAVESGFTILTATSLTAFPLPGDDHTGDRIADLPIQTDRSGNGHFTLFDGSDRSYGIIVGDYDFGLPNDLLVPGNRVGNSWGDTTVVRNVSGNLEWFTRDSQTEAGSATTGSGDVFGLATDYLLNGDWDGDGFSDLAVFRPDGANTRFLIERSGGAGLLEYFYGEPGDYPVSNGQVH